MSPIQPNRYVRKKMAIDAIPTSLRRERSSLDENARCHSDYGETLGSNTRPSETGNTYRNDKEVKGDGNEEYE